MRISHPSTITYFGLIPLAMAVLGCTPETELVKTEPDPRRLAEELINQARPLPNPASRADEPVPEIMADADPDTIPPAAAGGLGRLENAPNPFNPATELFFTVPEGGGSVTLAIHGVDGRVARHLVMAHLPGGAHTVVWRGGDDDGRPLPSGVYFARLSSGPDVRIRKLVMVQ